MNTFISPVNNFTVRCIVIVIACIAGGSVAPAQAGTGACTVSGKTVTLSDTAITASGADESGILIENGGNLSIAKSKITTSGNTSSSDSSSFYGLNAGILARNGGTVTVLKDCDISTSGKGANGVFAYGTGTISMENDTINCTAQYAHGIMCSGGGTITVKNCRAKTTNGNGGVIATDRGGGHIFITGGYYEATGKSSPGIYSTDSIVATDATFKCAQTAGVIIEGGNWVTLTNCTLAGADKGAKLFQSMSGDAEGTTPHFTMTGGSFSTASGPLLYGTNANSTTTLTRVTVSNPSDTLIYADSASKGGGIVNLVARHQTVKGTANTDRYSAFSITLQDSSSWTGNANKTKTAKNSTVTLDATSTWTVTGESHVASVTDAGISGTTAPNIIGNGNCVYYTPASSGSLGGKSYSLVGGGYLLPEGTVVGTALQPSRPSVNKTAMTSTTTTGFVGFDRFASGTTKHLNVYDLQGKRVAKTTCTTNTIDLCKAIGLSQGHYVINAVELR